MNKMKLAAFAAFMLISATSFAGGILTNTNQSAHFLRNPARDASTEIDAVYTNPAGLIKLPEGFHFSLNNQSAFQTRTITSTSAYFGGLDVQLTPTVSVTGIPATREFEGKASAPIIPSGQAVYRKGNWALSGSFAVTGGGGKATFENGLPSFEAIASNLPGVVMQAVAAGSPLKANNYQVEQYMRGSSMIIGLQLGATYKINEMFSAYGGFRMNIVNNSYEGHMRGLKTNLTPLASPFTDQYNYATQIIEDAIASTSVNPNLTPEQKQETLYNLGLMRLASSDTGVMLDVKQSGWGVSPILGFNFSYNKLNVGMKYEFRTRLNLENEIGGLDNAGIYKQELDTPHDIPALFTIGASYEITSKLTASIGYHHFFDSDAKMEGDKQKYINGGTNEFIAGLEYKINDMFLISGGVQSTNYGVTDRYQKDLSFSCDSYGLCVGGAANVSKKVRINIGYMHSFYSDYEKIPGIGTTKDVFSRTNKVFGAGVDFSF